MVPFNCLDRLASPADLSFAQHGEHVKNLGKKLGNAVVFGAGATAGSDAVNAALGK